VRVCVRACVRVCVCVCVCERDTCLNSISELSLSYQNFNTFILFALP